MGEQLRVIIIDDDRSYLTLCESVAATDARVAIVATSESGRDLEDLLDDVAPEVVIIDLAMPDIDGVTLAGTAGATGARVIVATDNDFAPLRELALASGADAVLPKHPVMTLFDRVREAVNAA